MWLNLAILLIFGQLSERVLAQFPHASPLRLPLSTGGFVRVMAGYPGVYLELQLNFSSNDVELYLPLDRRSQTSSLRADGTGAEVFYLSSDIGLWLPYRLNIFPVKESFVFYPRGDGSIGLGRYSPMWRFWQNFTVNNQYLYLGSYDAYSQLDYNEHGPVMSIDQPTTCQLSDGSTCSVLLDPGRMDTYLPVALFDQPPDYLILRSENCKRHYREMGLLVDTCSNEEEFRLSDTAIKSVAGLDYNATRRYEGAEIRLGQHFLNEYSLFHDRIMGQQFFTRSAFSFPPSVFTAMCIVLLAFVLVAWVAVVIADNYTNEWTLNLTFMLEFYGYLISGVGWATAVFGMQWSRLVANFLRMNPLPLMLFIGLVLLTCFAGSLWVLYHFELQITTNPRPGRMERNRTAARKLKLPRLLFFPTATLINLWLCVLQHHNALPDVVYLLFFVTTLCINASVLAYNAYVYSMPYQWIYYVALLPLYLFMWFTLVPTFNVIDLHYSTAMEVISYTIFVVLMPSLVLFMKFAIKQTEDRLQTTKEKQAA